MEKAAISAFVLLTFAVSFASAATLFGATPSDDDFCFGYAICQ